MRRTQAARTRCQRTGSEARDARASSPPARIDTRTQPVAIDDVVATLADLAEREDVPDEVRLDGRDVLSYREMMSRAARPQRPPQGLRGARRALTPVSLLRRHKPTRIANAVITDPERHTVIDAHGGVRSIQAADLTMPARELDAIWSPMHLERLARTYWRFLSRCTLGLIRVVYGRTERAVVVLRRPFVLLRFHAPEYEHDAERGMVRWRIRDGILVARRGREGEGYLEIEVRRCPVDEPGMARARVSVEVANFYPAIASKLTRFVYRNTQSRIHVLVTHGFLRSLARLDLAESAVGRFAGQGPRPPEESLEPTSPEARARARAASVPSGE